MVVLEDKISFWRGLTLPTALPASVGVGVGKAKSGRDNMLVEGVDVRLLGVVEQDIVAVVVLRATIVMVVLA
jgi:hypothetical protein